MAKTLITISIVGLGYILLAKFLFELMFDYLHILFLI